MMKYRIVSSAYRWTLQLHMDTISLIHTEFLNSDMVEMQKHTEGILSRWHFKEPVEVLVALCNRAEHDRWNYKRTFHSWSLKVFYYVDELNISVVL